MRVLISWIGRSDLKTVQQHKPQKDPGPVLRLLQNQPFDEIHLLNDIAEAGKTIQQTSAEYREWLLKQNFSWQIYCHDASENLHNDYNKAYEFTARTIRQIYARYERGSQFAILLSPGNAAAQVAMLLAAHTLFEPSEVELLNTSKERGIERVDLSYSIKLDVVPAIVRRWQRDRKEEPIGPAFDQILGQSEAILGAKRIAQKVAPFPIPVLIRGETGTGKELFAKAIHQASPRKDKPFRVLHCAALSETLLESELFGHVKGAFTGADRDRKGLVEEADKGTLFIDEVGDLTLNVQVKLLRFLEIGEFSPVGSNQPKQVDVRILAATHKNLERGIAEGWFREDLFYRLDGMTLQLPPLRERGEDIYILAQEFLNQINTAYSLEKIWDEEALQMLHRYPWRGNVRQLKQAVGRLAILSAEDKISADDVVSILSEPEPIVARPLQELTSEEFGAYLVAVVEETLVRFRYKGQLPWQFLQDASLVDELLMPLVVGRAVGLTQDNWHQAGKLYQRSGLDRNNPTDRNRYKKYQTLIAQIEESLVRRLRTGV